MKLANMKEEWVEEFEAFHLAHNVLDIQEMFTNYPAARPNAEWDEDRGCTRIFNRKGDAAMASGYIGRIVTSQTILMDPSQPNLRWIRKHWPKYATLLEEHRKESFFIDSEQRDDFETKKRVPVIGKLKDWKFDVEALAGMIKVIDVFPEPMYTETEVLDRKIQRHDFWISQGSQLPEITICNKSEYVCM